MAGALIGALDVFSTCIGKCCFGDQTIFTGPCLDPSLRTHQLQSGLAYLPERDGRVLEVTGVLVRKY